MKVGLVHGRFQPFHNGHKFLVGQMLKESDVGVVLVGSADKHDERNPYPFSLRQKMIRSTFPSKKLLIGGNLDLPDPYNPSTPWDVLLASCVFSLAGRLPTTVYAAADYTVPWIRVNAEVKTYARYNDTAGAEIRSLIRNGKINEVEKLVPAAVFQLMKGLS